MRKSNYFALAVLAALVAGLLVGWLVIGWWLWPVQWINALPEDLSPESRNVYVIGVAYTFEVTKDVERTRQAMAALGTVEQQSQALDAAITASPADIQALTSLRQELRLPAVPGEVAPRKGVMSWLGPLLISLLVVLIIGLGGIFLLARVRRFPLSMPAWPVRLFSRLSSLRLWPAPSSAPVVEITPQKAIEPQEVAKEAITPMPAPRPGCKLAAFTPTFQRGIQEYNENFNLNALEGSGYLGECGMGISETLGGDDSRVTALEVWLFDKSDIRTQACVLMSEHAHDDPAIYSRLIARGQGLLARPGQTFTIESESLQLVGRIQSVAYADDDVPPQSVFKEVKVSLEVYLKE